MFSLRIVNVDSYQSAPTKGHDICYSEFRGCEIFKVPIIRIFGITPAGQKGCLHVHGVFPYFSIRCKDVFPNIEPKSLRKCMQELALDIDKALNVAARNSGSHRHHVYKIIVTEHIPFYGFHEKAEEFLKIYFYNPFDVSRTAELMTNGVILNKFIQPYEAHIPYILQFFIDYNLFGMNLINVSKFKFRASEDDLISAVSPLRNQSLSHILDESTTSANKIWNVGTFSNSQVSNLPRQTVCELEVDCCSSEIMNRLNKSFSSGKNPGLLAIWEEERQRRKSENDASLITPVPSQERADFIETESENFFKKKLRKLLESFDMFKVCQKDKLDHISKGFEDVASPNISDLSSTQDEDMLNIMLSMVNSQTTQLDDDSILGFNHQNDLQNEAVEDETLEMSQLFTGELEEMWSSQITDSDTHRDRTNFNTSTSTISEQLVVSNENTMIPQLDGAFDDDFVTDNKHSGKNTEKASASISEESLIRSCTLLQPVVQLSPTIFIKTEVKSPAESRPESGVSSEVIYDDSSASTSKRTSFPVCVPVSKNAHCSLIMNIYENSNDVSIEHTCTSRNSIQYDSLADAEDPANVVFEVITNLIYKVECLTEGRSSCYEHLTEEYSGENCSDFLLQSLSMEEKNTLRQIKIAPSDFKDKSLTKRANYIEPYLSLPIKKRIFNDSWNNKELNQCNSCSHALSVDFSKIGKEIVLVKKLSESDFINHVKLNSMKVVIPPLPLHLQTTNKLTTSLKKNKNNPKPMSLLPKKDFKVKSKKSIKLKNNSCDNNKLFANKINSSDDFKHNLTFADKQTSFTSSLSKKTCLTVPSTSDPGKLGTIAPYPVKLVNNQSNESTDFKLLYDNENYNASVYTDSKSISSFEDLEINRNSESLSPYNDPEISSNCADLKVISHDTELKILPNNSDSEIIPDITDIEIASDHSDSKKPQYSSESLIIPDSFEPIIIPDSFDPVIIPDNLDFLISPKSVDSLITRDDIDSEIAADNTDSKIASEWENSEISVDNTDSKIASDCEDSEIAVDNIDSKIISDCEDSEIAVDNIDSKIASDSEIAVDNIDSKIASDCEDCEIAVGNTDSKIASDCNDSKFTTDNSFSNIVSDCKDSKFAADNSDPKIASDCENSEIAADNIDSKIASDCENAKTAADNTDSKISSDCKNSKVAADNTTDSKITSDCENSKTAEHNTDAKIASYCENSEITSTKASCKSNACDLVQDNSHKKAVKSTSDNPIHNKDYDTEITLDNKCNKTVSSINSESEKFTDTTSNTDDKKKCTIMSELRLYRRKKIPGMRQFRYPNFNCELGNESKDYDTKSIDCGTTSIGSRVREKNSSDLQIEYIGTTSKFKTLESAPKCIPVVQLEPCKELIDKYCKSETDTDCLILGEVSHEQKTPPVVKEKRFFRSRVRQQKDRLTSNIVINHKLGMNNTKSKNSRFLANKRGRRNSLSNFSVQRTNGPILRKRSANFDSPDKKKLQPTPGSNHTSFSSEKNSLEQVYDFESHLNADENGLDDKYFSRYSLKNKSHSSMLKKNVSSKLSLKLNRKKNNEAQDDYIPEYGVSIDSDSQKVVRPRRTSSVVSYNEDEYPPLEENLILPKRLRKSNYDDFQILQESENSTPDDLNSVPGSDENSDWCIDDIPISNLRPHESLKCTILRKNNIYISHENEKFPIPKFKVRKKKGSNSLNVSIKLKKPPLVLLDDDPDFKTTEKSYYCIPSKKKKVSKKSKKKSHAFASALDVKQKYKKHKESRNECLKNAILQYCNSMVKNKGYKPSECTKLDEQKTMNKKSDFCKPNIPSHPTYNSNSIPKDENSDISNSPVTEDNSDDSKRSKSSLKMKLKLKRITTRSNEERIVVVGKELEGIETEDDENEDNPMLTEEASISKPLNDTEINEKLKTSKKTLGTKSIKRHQSDCKLKTKFKCPLLIENKKVEKSITDIQENVDKENFKGKIPKFRYKPLLANITKDLLSDGEYSTATAPSSDDISPHKILIVSPKKKSPLKNAELIQKELVQLNEMACANVDLLNLDTYNVDSKNVPSAIHVLDNNAPKKLSTEKNNTLPDSDIPSSPQCKLREKKLSTDSKIPPRRNSLRCQDLKKYSNVGNEDNAVEAVISHDHENLEPLESNLSLTCKPCTIDLERLSAFEIERYVCKSELNLHKSEMIMACEPIVASFPSPIVDSKSGDSYIDPRKIFENLFTFSSPSRSHSPINFNAFETSPLIIENDMSCGPFSNESSEHSRKEILKTSFTAQNPLKPNDVFKSVERDDMGVLWNLAYFSPPQVKAQEKIDTGASVIERKIKGVFDQKDNFGLFDDLQKLARQANEVCSLSSNLMESESENSISVLNEKVIEINSKSNICDKETKISFENILEKNITKALEDFESIASFSQTPTKFEVECMSNKSETLDTMKDISTVIKEEPKSDPVFESMESLPNVRILDFQECLVESDSEMNPLLNDSEIDSVMSSADMILSHGLDTQNYDQCLETDLTFDDQTLNIENKSKCASEEPKNSGIDVFIKSSIESSLQKELSADLTCNNAIITAADTSSLLIPSYKNNTIPVLAVNNTCQEATVNFASFDEQNLNANNQFLPVMLTPVPVTENPNCTDNSATTVKENESDPQECVNFLEDNELLQSCSVSSTSDIENKNTQASNALGIPFNGEEDILSMIVKSCDIGEEFDVNINSAEETDGGNISSAAVCNNLVDNNFVMSGPNFIINSQTEQNSLQTNSENAVSSSSENNLLQKNPEIVVIKTEPVDVPDVEHFVYELQDKNLNLSHANKNMKPSDELPHDDNVLLDSMIHSFYGDDSLYGLHSSANSDNVPLLCSTFQNNTLPQDAEKVSAECNATSFKSVTIKTEDNAPETSSYKSESYFKNLSSSQNDSFQFKNAISSDKAPLSIISNSLLVAHSYPKVSSKRFHFTPISKPPTREFFENSAIKSDTDDDLKLNLITEEDSLSSDSSLSLQLSTNDTVVPNVFSRTSLEENEHLGSQNGHSLTKSTPHCENKPSIKSPSLLQDRTVSNLSFSHHLASTPSTSNIKKEFTLPDVIISPINKETDTNKRKRKLVFENDDSTGPLKLFKSGREKVYGICSKLGRNGSLNKSSDSLGNLSYSQIEGPTLENSRGFKVGSDNYGDAQVRHEVQHLTVMSLEIHVNTRNDLRPNPKFDSVAAIFYCIYNDIGINEEEEIVGMIVVDPVSHLETSGQNSAETLKNYLLLCPGVKNGFIYCVENEVSLFEKLIKIIREWDPDILTGYEIQMSSWGYLIERAEMLNINLRLLLSRLIDKNETKMLPIEPDPTVTDQTADLSRLNIIGRIVLCVWRLMRKEVTLNVYSFENVYYHVLHKRTPLYAFHDLTNWFLGSQKEKVIRYYVIRVQGSIHLLEKLDVIGRTSELARLFGIQFYEVLSRGSQFRVESMMLRTAAPMSYIPVSPSVRQRSHSRAPERIPLILEPESRFYIDPVVVLDFQSLYPSMIIAYNYCFSTCLGRVEHFGKNVPFEFGCTSLSVPITLLQKHQNDIHVSPPGIAFVKSSVRRGILPSMLEEILNTRIMVKQSMKKIKSNNALKRLLDARQLGLKLISNVTYGYTGATFSGRMPNVEVADSIVGKGRETLERAIHMIENTSKWRAKVVYGDTDSLFILLPGRTKKQAFEIGQEIADAVTADNPKPVKLKFEKVYLPCVLQTKKRYVGFMYETVDQETPVFDAKGIETVRRDSCPATAKILEKSLKILFKSYDVSLVMNYVQKQFSKLLSGRANIIDCIFAKEYRGISGYRPGACVPALEIAKKRLAKDPRSEPRVGERVPYVVVYGFPGLPIIQLVREPIELLRDVNLRINASYYITRVISPPLERVFNLLGADVKSWYTNLARTFKPTLPMTRTTNQHRGTLSQYFVTLSCPSCEKPTFTAVCDDCREDLQGTTIALNEKIRQWERKVDHLTQICGSCTKSGSSIDSCVSLDCPMLFKLNAAKKDLSQAPYLRNVLAHELF